VRLRILTEAILSFLGAGISRRRRPGGNIMAEGPRLFSDQTVADLLAWIAAVDRDPQASI